MAAISEFPVPQKISNLRSLFGLVNQLSQFSTEISKAAEPLRGLLSTKNAFLWTPDHQAAFEATKTALSKPEVLVNFEVGLPTRLQTDALRKNGLGYVLSQQHNGLWRIVQCGSRFITPTESRYAMIELEILAVVWATQKCRVLLQGLDGYEVVTDHKPAIPILNNYTLADIENPRIRRLKEKLSGYVFTAHWVKGKNNIIPDALSRAPTVQPSEDDLEFEKKIRSIAVQRVVCAVETLNPDSTGDLKRRRRNVEEAQGRSGTRRRVSEAVEGYRRRLPNQRY